MLGYIRMCYDALKCILMCCVCLKIVCVRVLWCVRVCFMCYVVGVVGCIIVCLGVSGCISDGTCQGVF